MVKKRSKKKGQSGLWGLVSAHAQLQCMERSVEVREGGQHHPTSSTAAWHCSHAFSGLSKHPKFVALTNVLAEKAQLPAFHGIVFARTREAVRSLARLIAACPDLKDVEVRQQASAEQGRGSKGSVLGAAKVRACTTYICMALLWSALPPIQRWVVRQQVLPHLSWLLHCCRYLRSWGMAGARVTAAPGACASRSSSWSWSSSRHQVGRWGRQGLVRPLQLPHLGEHGAAWTQVRV